MHRKNTCCHFGFQFFKVYFSRNAICPHALSQTPQSLCLILLAYKVFHRTYVNPDPSVLCAGRQQRPVKESLDNQQNAEAQRERYYATIHKVALQANSDKIPGENTSIRGLGYSTRQSIIANYVSSMVPLLTLWYRSLHYGSVTYSMVFLQ